MQLEELLIKLREAPAESWDRTYSYDILAPALPNVQSFKTRINGKDYSIVRGCSFDKTHNWFYAVKEGDLFLGKESYITSEIKQDMEVGKIEECYNEIYEKFYQRIGEQDENSWKEYFLNKSKAKEADKESEKAEEFDKTETNVGLGEKWNKFYSYSKSGLIKLMAFFR